MNAPRSYTRETFSLSSIAPDRIPQDAPADVWNSANNIAFRNGETLRVFGDSPTMPGATGGARTCVFIQVGAQGYWVYATTSGIYAHDGGNEHDITPTGGWAGDEDATWTSCVLNGIAYINASSSAPVYWNGDIATPCEPLPDWPSSPTGTCLALRAHKNFLFAIGMTSEGAQRVRWSDAAAAGEVPQFWTPAADNLAGFLDISPLSSPCLEGETLRDSFLVYKRESIWSFDFVGGNAVFRARKLFAEHGIVNTNAVTKGIDDVHLFAGDEGDVFITDGVKVESVLDGRAQRTFFADFTQNEANLFAATTLSREKLGFICYPRAGSQDMDRALMVDFVSGDIGFRDLPGAYCAAEGAALADTTANSWDVDAEAWDDDPTNWPTEAVGATLDDVLIGGPFGFLLMSDAGANEFYDGTPVVAVLEKSGLAFGNPQAHKLISRIWPKITGREGDTVFFRLGGQEVTGGPITLQPETPFTIGQNVSLDVFVQGRFLFMEVKSLGGNPWRMGSFDIEYRELGGW